MSLVEQMAELDMTEVPEYAERELLQWCKEMQGAQDAAFADLLNKNNNL